MTPATPVCVPPERSETIQTRARDQDKTKSLADGATLRSYSHNLMQQNGGVSGVNKGPTNWLCSLTLSAHPRRSPGSCVTMINPTWALNFWMSSMIPRCPLRSTPASGSSSKRRDGSGLRTSCDARANRRFWPPESCLGDNNRETSSNPTCISTTNPSSQTTKDEGVCP